MTFPKVKVGQMERHFWCFALCRSPHGWAMNLGAWIFTFGDFASECRATREANEEAGRVDDQGLPVHLLLPVAADGQGPATGDDFHHWACWCAHPTCAIGLEANSWATREEGEG